MTHSHAHNHSHGSHAAEGDNIGRLRLVLVLTSVYMLVEFAGGLWANSLALLADAGHMLTDVGAVGLALFAAWFARHPTSSQRTYGFYRLEILAALINGVALAVIAIYIFYEAVHRMFEPPEVRGVALIWIATGGLIINLIAARILYQAGQHNINVRAAFVHVLSDTLGSLGAIVAGVLIFFFQFYLADVIFSVLIALLVLVNAWKLIGEATNILLEACPVHLNVGDIKQCLLSLPEVQSVHDLHVWCITSGKDAMSVHVVVSDASHYTPQLVTRIQHDLKEQFGITHLTIQLETPDFEEDEIHF
jgi:cobalt-zinc-cadmium efflux system protein